jgi:hypothetical protein
MRARNYSLRGMCRVDAKILDGLSATRKLFRNALEGRRWRLRRMRANDYGNSIRALHKDFYKGTLSRCGKAERKSGGLECICAIDVQ